MLEYVRALLNPMPHLHATDAIYEVERDRHHGVAWHIDGIQNGFRHLKPHIPLVRLKVGYYSATCRSRGRETSPLCPAATRRSPSRTPRT